MDIQARIPVIVLDYNQKDKAVGGELVINYETCQIFIVDKSNPTLLKDVTSYLIKQCEGMKADKNIVYIQELGGNITLNSALLAILEKAKTTVQVRLVDDHTRFLRKGISLDKKSVDVSDFKELELKGFYNAPDLSLPMKNDKNELVWVDATELTGNTATGENPIDGLNGTIVEIEPDNNVIHLRASRKQITENLKASVNVILPSTLDKYSRIDWCLVTNSYKPSLRFSSNVLWKYGNGGKSNQPIGNSFHVYIFETWDGGEHWLARIVLFSDTNANFDGTIDLDYLNANYYTIPETDELLSWDTSKDK